MMDLLERGLELLRHRSASYRDVFLGHGQSSDDVLQDLAKFCYAYRSTFHVEHTISDRLDGRREVWLRIAQHLHLDEEQLWEIYGNKSITNDSPKE